MCRHFYFFKYNNMLTRTRRRLSLEVYKVVAMVAYRKSPQRITSPSAVGEAETFSRRGKPAVVPPLVVVVVVV